MKDFTLPASPIPAQRISDLLCSAFEGGSNYWYEDMEIHKLTPGLVKTDFGQGGKMQGEEYQHWSTLVPMTEGCSIKFRVSEDSPWEEGKAPAGFPLTIKDDVCTVILDRAAIQKGLDLFAKVAPKHYADWVADNTDADTGDAFLQICCFGEIVFG